MAAMLRAIEREALDKNLLRKGMVQRFAQDCIQFASELSRVLRKDGQAVLVVGNSTLRGNYIRNDVIVQTAMEIAGFTLNGRYEREIPPSRRYMAIETPASSNMGRRMRTEVVMKMGR
ncbi:hypothetical protein ASD06_16685 [Angustibacter sp. Root456]|nr:hypothetical protein ASD06_16685 [Angustibacter sp. Root456]